MRRLLAAVTALLLVLAGRLGPVLSMPTVYADERFRITPDPSGQIPYFVATGGDNSGYRGGDAQLVVWALQEWERSTGGAVRFRPSGDEASALLRVRWLPWAEDAALGRMEPTPVGDRVVALVDVRPDESRFRPSVRRRVNVDPLMRDVVLYYVCLHEIGHALGLSHTDNPRDIMWPGANGVTLPIYDRYRHPLTTRDDIPLVSWLSRDDIARVKAIWQR